MGSKYFRNKDTFLQSEIGCAAVGLLFLYFCVEEHDILELNQV